MKYFSQNKSNVAAIFDQSAHEGSSLKEVHCNTSGIMSLLSSEVKASGDLAKKVLGLTS